MKSTDLGVFLHRSVYSESSLIVSFFTKEHGLQKFLFRGGKKKAHSLFPMAVCELSYYGRKDAELLNLTEVETIHPFTFQFNPVTSTIAYFLVECIKKSVQQGDSDKEVFHFLVSYAQRLETDENKGFLPLRFLLDFTDVLGFKPHFEKVEAKCFNLDAGVFQSHVSGHERIVSGPAADLIAAMLSNELFDSSWNKNIREEALKVMLDYYKIHIPRFENLTSFDIVKEILNA